MIECSGGSKKNTDFRWERCGEESIRGGANALIRRPYGPYVWNVGFQHSDDPSRYYQAVYSIDKATFGAPYFSSYDNDKTWDKVVAPKIARRDANLLK